MGWGRGGGTGIGNPINSQRQQWREQTSRCRSRYDRRGWLAAQHGQNEINSLKKSNSAPRKRNGHSHEAAIGSNCGSLLMMWHHFRPVFFSFSRQMNSINCVFGSSVTSTVVPHGFVYAFASSMVIPMSM